MLVASWKRRWCSSWWCLPWCWCWSSLFCARPLAGLRCGLLGFLIMPEGEGGLPRQGAWASLNVILHSRALVLLQNIQNSEKKKQCFQKHCSVAGQNLSIIIAILSLSLTLSSLSAILQDNLQKRTRSLSKFVICNKSRSTTKIL